MWVNATVSVIPVQCVFVHMCVDDSMLVYVYVLVWNLKNKALEHNIYFMVTYILVIIIIRVFSMIVLY